MEYKIRKVDPRIFIQSYRVPYSKYHDLYNKIRDMKIGECIRVTFKIPLAGNKKYHLSTAINQNFRRNRCDFRLKVKRGSLTTWYILKIKR